MKLEIEKDLTIHYAYTNVKILWMKELYKNRKRVYINNQEPQFEIKDNIIDTDRIGATAVKMICENNKFVSQEKISLIILEMFFVYNSEAGPIVRRLTHDVRRPESGKWY